MPTCFVNDLNQWRTLKLHVGVETGAHLKYFIGAQVSGGEHDAVVEVVNGVRAMRRFAVCDDGGVRATVSMEEELLDLLAAAFTLLYKQQHMRLSGSKGYQAV